MQLRSNHDLDPTDILILKELARDGRMPVKQLAARAGISQHIARSRLHKMMDNGVVAVAAIPVSQFTKASVEAFIGFNIKAGHSVHIAAEKLAAHASFRYVAIASGPYDIVTWGLFDNLENLSTFLRCEIGEIDEIASSETLINLDTLKNLPAYPVNETVPGPFISKNQRKMKKVNQIDALDAAIIDELREDGRMTVVELAAKLGISRASATRRLQRLLAEDLMVILAIIAPGSFGYDVTARIGIKVYSGKVDDVARKLASFDEVHFVAVTLGHYDILLGVHFTELHGLSDFTGNVLGQIPEIMKSDEMIYLETVKSFV